MQGHLELVAAVAAKRTDHVAGQTLGVKPRGHVLRAHHVAVDQRHVLLPVAVIPECHDPESSKTARQVGDGVHLDAHVVHAVALTIMVLVALDQIFEPRDSRQTGAGRLGHFGSLARAARSGRLSA